MEIFPVAFEFPDALFFSRKTAEFTCLDGIFASALIPNGHQDIPLLLLDGSTSKELLTPSLALKSS